MKVKLINPDKGRNRSAFFPFLTWPGMFEMFDIEFSTYGSSDITFIGIDDFVDRKVSLEDSINKGIEFINKYKHERVFLFDPTDSTSLLGIYEVLANTNSQFLFKNQILNFTEYKYPTYFNKWFFSDCDDEIKIGYDITEKNRNKIRLSGWNLGFTNNAYHTFNDRNLNADLECDICAIYQYEHDINMDHGFRNDIAYTNHRYRPYEILHEMSNLKVAMGKVERSRYYEILNKSKFAISPFGMGEICYRDFELMQLGIPMIKPLMDKVLTEPNPYIPWETYIPVNPDWSNLTEIVNKILSEDYSIYLKMVENFRKTYRHSYLVSSLIQKWKNILN